MSVPRYPNETEAEPVHPDAAQAALDDGALVVEPAIHPVDAFVEAAERWYPGKPISDELLAQARAWCDAPVCTTCGGSGEIDERMGGIATSGIVSCPDCDGQPAEVDVTTAGMQEAEPMAVNSQDAVSELTSGGYLPEHLVRHLRLLAPVFEKWSSASHQFPGHSGLFTLTAATMIEDQAQEIDDLKAKLDAERTLRAQASAELEREKARERDRRLEADAAARDRLWAIDALVEALVPLAGYATEEDGRVAGMTSPVCLAMSSVRRADALVKLHRALRR